MVGFNWCETRKWVNWILQWLGYLWPWPLTFNFQGQIVSREWEARLWWDERHGSRLYALMWNTKEICHWTMRWLWYLWPGSLTLNFQGQVVFWEWEAGPIITPTKWPRVRGYCLGPGWLNMSVFPSTRLVLRLTSYCLHHSCYVSLISSVIVIVQTMIRRK